MLYRASIAQYTGWLSNAFLRAIPRRRFRSGATVRQCIDWKVAHRISAMWRSPRDTCTTVATRFGAESPTPRRHIHSTHDDDKGPSHVLVVGNYSHQTRAHIHLSHPHITKVTRHLIKCSTISTNSLFFLWIPQRNNRIMVTGILVVTIVHTLGSRHP